MLDIPSISAVVAAFGVIVGVVFTILELRNLVKARQTDLALRLYSHFGSKEFLEARRTVMELEFKNYNDYVKKYGRFGRVEAVSQVCMFFQGMGVLLHRKLLSISLIDELFSPISIKIIWEKMKPVVEGWRKQFNEPRTLERFENLCNELKKREQTLTQSKQ
ncbi:MAG: hypothetical protein JSV64_04580 [Candidatus Bathyarchaeota archaeon]|nr:MAG: hypothetical protein JSV64_04580 [Candidatus Bathyarchaeota archaeon]